MAAKAARYEFFVTRWTALYDWVSGTVQAARVGADAAAATDLQVRRQEPRDGHTHVVVAVLRLRWCVCLPFQRAGGPPLPLRLGSVLQRNACAPSGTNSAARKQAEKLGIVLRKAIRAKEVLLQVTCAPPEIT